jgi:hypothetical protein
MQNKEIDSNDRQWFRRKVIYVVSNVARIGTNKKQQYYKTSSLHIENLSRVTIQADLWIGGFSEYFSEQWESNGR